MMIVPRECHHGAARRDVSDDRIEIDPTRFLFPALPAASARQSTLCQFPLPARLSDQIDVPSGVSLRHTTHQQVRQPGPAVGEFLRQPLPRPIFRQRSGLRR
jgi:hypothetical protein